MPAPEATSSLYERIGGRPGLLRLLRFFYADVRQHPEIAEIFTSRIHDWPAHLEKIADFWSGVTGGPAVYQGRMPVKHFPLGLEERHFLAWLDLWTRHCRAHLPAPEAAELIAAAENIGRALRQMVATAARRRDPACEVGRRGTGRFPAPSCPSHPSREQIPSARAVSSTGRCGVSAPRLQLATLNFQPSVLNPALHVSSHAPPAHAAVSLSFVSSVPSSSRV